MTPVHPTTHVLRQEGEYWTLEFRGQVVRLKDSKGLRYLAVLLRHPGRKIPATDLVARSRSSNGPAGGARSNGSSARRSEKAAERARLTVTKGIKNALVRIAVANPVLGQHLEATVRRGYACIYAPDPLHPVSWVE